MTQHDATRSCRCRPRRPAGFTLMEILIALSIFGVGLAMAASLFPASVAEHEKAVEYTLGTMMCHNGIAMAKAQCTHPQSGSPAILSGRQKFPSDNAATDPFYQYAVTVTQVGTDNSYDIKVQAFKGGAAATDPFKTLTVRTPLTPKPETTP